MYKVLLVDDERIEREGISKLINWGENSLNLIGAAKNGIEACQIIENNPPDIVITDIKMPVISGIELIAKVKINYPNIAFVVLSGYGEYEYTSKAMFYGVRHYLLKPCTEDKIMRVLNDVIKELDKKANEKQQLHNLEGNFEKVLPQAKEDFLRKLVLTKIYDKNNCDHFKTLFGIQEEEFKLITFQANKSCDFIDKYALKNIAEETIGCERVYLCTMVNDCVLLIAKAIKASELNRLLLDIKKAYQQYFNIQLSIAVGETCRFEDIHEMYKKTQQYLRYRFEMPEDCIITKESVENVHIAKTCDFSSEVQGVIDSIKAEDKNSICCRLDVLFFMFIKEEIGQSEILVYCEKLYKALYLLGKDEVKRVFGNDSPEFDKSMDAGYLCKMIRIAVIEIVNNNELLGKQSLNDNEKLVNQMIKCIYQNISNPQLRLTWIAKNVLFINEEYLGRIFLKVMNQKFSQYLLKVRIEMAKKLIENSYDFRIYEISKMTGFPEDAQYFSKVFKNYTGITPTEYKRIHTCAASEQNL